MEDYWRLLPAYQKVDPTGRAQVGRASYAEEAAEAFHDLPCPAVTLHTLP